MILHSKGEYEGIITLEYEIARALMILSMATPAQKTHAATIQFTCLMQ